MAELVNLENLQAVLADFAKDMQTNYKDELQHHDRYTQYRHALYDSVVTRVEMGSDAFEVKMDLLSYWKYVEYGTNPHFPPVSALLEWIEVKPVIPRPNEKGVTPTNNQLAYLIGRSIAENGTKGSNTLQITKDNILPWYRERIAQALGHDMQFYIRKLVKMDE